MSVTTCKEVNIPEVKSSYEYVKARPHETTLSCKTCCVRPSVSCGRENRPKIGRARLQGKSCTTKKKVAPCSILRRQIPFLERKQPIRRLYLVTMPTRYDVVM